MGHHGIKAVFWDMDGTLIDTEELHYTVIRDWCARHGLILTPKDNAYLVGKTMPEKWSIVQHQLQGQPTQGEFRTQCEQEYLAQLRPSMGLEKSLWLVQQLAQHGVMQACVSNAERAVLQANIAVLGLADTFTFSVCGEDVQKGKPHKDPYILAAQKAGVAPNECLVVEDSLVGVQAAASAGCVVCVWENSSVSFHEANYLLRSEKDFPFFLFT